MRPNLFVNTPDILTEYLQFGGPGGVHDPRGDRRDRGADLGRLRGLRALRERRATGRRGEHRQREVRVQAARLRRRREGGPLARALPRHPQRASAARTRRSGSCATSASTGATTTRSSSTRSTSTGRFTPDGRDDTVIVVANVDPHSVRETMVHLDLAAIGLAPGSRFEVEDLVTGHAGTGATPTSCGSTRSRGPSTSSTSWRHR